jgi:hypothetical protein
MRRRSFHPRRIKRFRSPESYRKFRAYVHMRTPTGKLAKHRGQTISARTPRRRKEKRIVGISRFNFLFINAFRTVPYIRSFY